MDPLAGTLEGLGDEPFYPVDRALEPPDQGVSAVVQPGRSPSMGTIHGVERSGHEAVRMTVGELVSSRLVVCGGVHDSERCELRAKGTVPDRTPAPPDGWQ